MVDSVAVMGQQAKSRVKDPGPSCLCRGIGRLRPTGGTEGADHFHEPDTSPALTGRQG